MNKIRVLFWCMCAGLLIWSVFAEIKSSRANEGHQNHQNQDDELTQITKDLETKRDILNERGRLLDEQESRIKTQITELDKKLKEMERLRSEISGELEKDRKNNEERVSKMVTVFETMTPKAAAAIMDTLDDWLSVEILKRMDAKRMAKIMAMMEKARSAKLSELLTGYYKPPVASQHHDGQGQAPRAPATEKSEKKGGAKDDKPHGK